MGQTIDLICKIILYKFYVPSDQLWDDHGNICFVYYGKNIKYSIVIVIAIVCYKHCFENFKTS